jgi:hypothetical protein
MAPDVNLKMFFYLHIIVAGLDFVEFIISHLSLAEINQTLFHNVLFRGKSGLCEQTHIFQINSKIKYL